MVILILFIMGFLSEIMFLGDVRSLINGISLSQSKLLFYNTLYDENASSHLAFGSGLRFNLEDGSDMSPDEFAAAGGNASLIHIDFMFGSAEMDVDGVLLDGTAEPIMRRGEWAFTV